jgi:hypothetical protein
MFQYINEYHFVSDVYNESQKLVNYTNMSRQTTLPECWVRQMLKQGEKELERYELLLLLLYDFVQTLFLRN